jgi:DNA-binding beta-propeller fold protein YncE
MLRHAVALLFLFASTSAGISADRLVLFAGGGDTQDNVPATQAKLISPFGIDFDATGNAYLVELAGERGLKVDSQGTLHIVAGTGKKGAGGDGGPARQATFNGMHSLAVQRKTGDVYLADTWNGRVRKLDPKTGTIDAVAGQQYIDPLAKKKTYEYAGDGGPAREARFGGIYCICLSPDGSKLYITDLENRRIRVLDLRTGRVDLVAGNGKKGVPADGADARTSPLVDPRACAVDGKGNVYILERGGHALRVVDAQGKIRTVAGTGKSGNTGDGGPAIEATLSGPKHLCIDHDGSVIIADTANHVIRRYRPSDGIIVRLAGTGKKGMSGSGGAPLEVSFNEPHGVTVHPDGTLYIVDSLNNRVFRWQK